MESFLFMDRRDPRNNSSAAPRAFLPHHHHHLHNQQQPPPLPHYQQPHPYHHHHHHHHLHQTANPSFPHHHFPIDDPAPPPSRFLVPHLGSGVPVLANHWNHAGMNGPVYDHHRHSELLHSSLGNPVSRSHHMLDWEPSQQQQQQQQERRHVSFPGLQRVEGESLRPESGYGNLEETAHFGQAVVRDVNRHAGLGRDARDDVRKNDRLLSVPLPELANSRRSAALSAKVFLDEVCPGEPFIPRSVYNVPPSFQEQHVSVDSDPTYYESAMLRNASRIVERGSPLPKAMSTCKRNREEESEIERERIVRQRRIIPSGLPVSIRNHASFTINRSFEELGNDPSLQKVLTGKRHEEDDWEDGQVTPLHSSSPPFSRHDFHFSSLSPRSKLIPNRYSTQQDLFARKLSSDRRDRTSPSPNRGLHQFLPPKSENISPIIQKTIDIKRFANQGGPIVETERHEVNMKDKSSILQQIDTSARKSDIGCLKDNSSKTDHHCRHLNDVESNKKRRSKKPFPNTRRPIMSGTLGKEKRAKQTPAAKRQRAASGRKESEPSPLAVKGLRTRKPHIPASTMSPVARVSGDMASNGLVIRKSPKRTSLRLPSRREVSISESDVVSSQVLHKVSESQLGKASLLGEDLPQLDSEFGHLNHARNGSGSNESLSSLSGQQQMSKPSILLQGGKHLSFEHKWPESQLPEVSLSVSRSFQPSSLPKKVQPSPEAKVEVQSGNEITTSASNSAQKITLINTESILHERQSFSVSECSQVAEQMHPIHNVSIQSTLPSLVQGTFCNQMGGKSQSLQYTVSAQASSSTEKLGSTLNMLPSSDNLPKSSKLLLEGHISTTSKLQTSSQPQVPGSIEEDKSPLFACVPEPLNTSDRTSLTDKDLQLNAREPTGNSSCSAGVFIGNTYSEQTTIKADSLLEVSEKSEGVLFKQANMLTSFSPVSSLQSEVADLYQQHSAIDFNVKGKMVISETDIPCCTTMPTIPLLGSSVASAERKQMGSPESQRPSGIMEVNNVASGQSDLTVECDGHLFGKTLKTSMLDSSQQWQGPVGLDVQCKSNARPKQVKKPLNQVSQFSGMEQQEDPLPSSSSKLVSHASSHVSLPCQQPKGTAVVVGGGAGEKVHAKVSHVCRSAQQFCQGRQVNALSHTPKLSLGHTHRQRPAMMPTSSRPGAHTWRRNVDTKSSMGFTAIPKVMKSSEVTSQAMQVSWNKEAPQMASYVRKGNSLVRAPISTSLPVISKIDIMGKEVSGKLLHSHANLQRTFSQLKNSKRNTTNTFKRVFSAEKPSATVANESLTVIEKLETPPYPLNKIATQGCVSFPHGQAEAISPVMSETEVNVVSSIEPVVIELEDELDNMPVENAKSSVSIPSNSSNGIGHDCLIPEDVSSMMNTELHPNVSKNIFNNSPCAEESELSHTVYVKSKSNQLVAAMPPNTLGLSKTVSQSGLPFPGNAVQDHYYKRKVNQLVRNSTYAENTTTRLVQGPAVVQEAKKLRKEAILRTKLGRVLSQKNAFLHSSRVWTLNGAKCGVACGTASKWKGVVPLLFPWKRPGFGLAVCSGRAKVLPKAKKGSLLFLLSKKLQTLHKRQPIYTRSAHGFSLHRSGVLSLGGANLKWTKSIESRSKKAHEEATKAVAAVEKKKREEKEAEVEAASAAAKAKADMRAARKCTRDMKLHPRERIVLVGLVRYKMDPSKRTLQRLPDQGSVDGDTVTPATTTADTTKLPTPRRLSIGGTEYVRVGNGSQLVRDPKATSRALASEKVRWSLHTVRSRHAKKQQYCQFFTRFGKCNKSKRKCPYIHDPEKVAVCTKFLKGTCLGTNCLLTHKVIPERMPDCSYFLEGLCTNENCPYRHVNVNPKAAICEGFLKGYCADGDECNKKHTYNCPLYTATGECPQRSSCKLHHPKKKDNIAVSVVKCKIGVKRKRRYFTALSLDERVMDTCRPNHTQTESLEDASTTDNLDEFINVPSIDIDVDEQDDLLKNLEKLGLQLNLLDGTGLVDDPDAWIKPTLLLQKGLNVGS